MSKAKKIKKLYRSRTDSMLGGVCGGIAQRMNWDPSLVRLIWVFFTLAGGSGFLLYLILWLIIPLEP